MIESHSLLHMSIEKSLFTKLLQNVLETLDQILKKLLTQTNFHVVCKFIVMGQKTLHSFKNSFL